MWRSKLGFNFDISSEVQVEADALWKQLESMMRFSVDFTMLFRLLAQSLEIEEEIKRICGELAKKSQEVSAAELVPGSLVRIHGLKSNVLAALEGYDGRLVSSGWGRFWSEHSERTTLPSGLAVLGVEKSDRDARRIKSQIPTTLSYRITSSKQRCARFVSPLIRHSTLLP
eukprot:g31575.t1